MPHYPAGMLSSSCERAGASRCATSCRPCLREASRSVSKILVNAGTAVPVPYNSDTDRLPLSAQPNPHPRRSLISVALWATHDNNNNNNSGVTLDIPHRRPDAVPQRLGTRLGRHALGRHGQKRDQRGLPENARGRQHQRGSWR